MQTPGALDRLAARPEQVEAVGGRQLLSQRRSAAHGWWWGAAIELPSPEPDANVATAPCARVNSEETQKRQNRTYG